MQGTTTFCSVSDDHIVEEKAVTKIRLFCFFCMCVIVELETEDAHLNRLRHHQQHGKFRASRRYRKREGKNIIFFCLLSDQKRRFWNSIQQ